MRRVQGGHDATRDTFPSRRLHHHRAGRSGTVGDLRQAARRDAGCLGPGDECLGAAGLCQLPRGRNAGGPVPKPVPRCAAGGRRHQGRRAQHHLAGRRGASADAPVPDDADDPGEGGDLHATADPARDRPADGTGAETRFGPCRPDRRVRGPDSAAGDCSGCPGRTTI